MFPRVRALMDTPAGRTIFSGRGFDQIVDLRHEVAKRARRIDCAFLEKTFGASTPTGPDIRRCRRG